MWQSIAIIFGCTLALAISGCGEPAADRPEPAPTQAEPGSPPPAEEPGSPREPGS